LYLFADLSVKYAKKWHKERRIALENKGFTSYFILLLKIRFYIQSTDPPEHLDRIDRVPGEAADRFCEDQVDISGFADFHHSKELCPVPVFFIFHTI